jgi:hypothetical protein
MMDDYTPGTWIWMKYGFEKHLFYVKATLGGDVVLGCPEWLNSSSVVFTNDEVQERGQVVGRTSARWWRPMCIFAWDLIPPYPKPAGLGWL